MLALVSYGFKKSIDFYLNGQIYGHEIIPNIILWYFLCS